MSDHARYSASGMPELAHCSGSVIVKSSVPEFSTTASMEGDAQHWVTEQCLRQGIFPTFFIGNQAPNGVVITQDMVDAVEVATKEVTGVCKKHNARQKLKLEHRVSMPSIHPTDCWGTLDAALDLRYLGIPKIYLWDFKFGYAQVNAKENYQAIAYLEGLRNELKIDRAEDQLIEVHVRIVQPNCFRQTGPVDEWVIKLSDIRGYVNKLRNQVHEAETDPKTRAGKHCRYCPGILRCTSAKEATYGLIDMAKQPLSIETYGNPDLATEYLALKDGEVLFKARKEAIEAELEHRIGQGAADTGLTIEVNKGRLKWTVPVEQSIAIGAQFGINLEKKDAVTPTQALKLAPKEMKEPFETVLKNVTTRQAGSGKLVAAGEGRVSRAFKPKET